MADTERVLRELIEKIAEEQQYRSSDAELQSFSTAGANYSSQLYRVTLHAPDKEDLVLFAKVLSISEHIRSQVPLTVFDIEKIFYSEILQRYREMEQKYNIPKQHRFSAINYYGCSNEYMKEILVLEDLSSKGFRMHDRFESFSWKYAAKAITELAKFHALSMAYDKIDPEFFSKFSAKFCIDEAREIVLKPMIENNIDMAGEVLTEENRERLQAFRKKNLDRKFDYYYKPLKRAVLAHGDFRASNLMHRVREDGEIEIVMLDYQTINISNPIVDLMYFIFSGTDEEFRDKHYRQLLDHYHSELCASLRRLDVDPDVTYSKEDFESDLKEIQPFGIILSVMLVPIVTVYPEDAPSLESGNITDFVAKPNDLAAKRLNGVINDFVKLGVL
ncbi:uncharacterized protein [Battus philenor]|uniref:uncharacterized protein n=1 Tax=Battus philenor TaxID=42288 RepID=UPI0035CFB829